MYTKLIIMKNELFDKAQKEAFRIHEKEGIAISTDNASLDIVKLNVTDIEIARLKAEYGSLTINGIEDKAGLKKVYESRQIVKKTRTGLVKYADDLKEKAAVWVKKVNAEKNRCVAELEAIEEHLQGQEDIIEAEKERLRQEAINAENERVQKRIDSPSEYGYGIDYAIVKSIDDPTFEKVLANAKVEHEKWLQAKAELARLEKEKADRLEAERLELEELRKQQAAAQKIIDDNNERIRKEQEANDKEIALEKKKIEDERKALELKKLQDEESKRLAAEIEKAKNDAAEKARLKLIEDQKKSNRKKMPGNGVKKKKNSANFLFARTKRNCNPFQMD